MKQPDLREVQRIFDELVFPFYGVKRDMYVPTEGNRSENDAEHSWSLAFMALMLTPKIDCKLDVQKVVTYAIIHDLNEIYAGDTSVWAKSEDRSTKQDREEASMEKIKLDFLEYPHLLKYLLDYRKRVDSEAKFVYALDKFHNWLTAYSGGYFKYKKVKKITQEQALKKLAEARPKAFIHPEVGKYFDDLIEAFKQRPEFFYPDKLNV
jgi:5'-deoxynucleotidase YfbR-like HD superfamily hydrolase